MKLSIRPVSSPFTPDARRQFSDSDGKWHLRLVLRLSASVLSLIAFSLFAAAIPTWNANFFHVTGPEEGDWQDGMPIAALVISFLHSLYHPVASTLSLPRPHAILTLTIDVIILALLIPSITLAGLGGLFTVWRPAIHNGPNDTIDCTSFLNSFARACNPILYSVGGLELGGVILSSFVWALTFGLMFFSAIDVHRWRRSRHTARNSVLTGSNFGMGQGNGAPFLELGVRNQISGGGRGGDAGPFVGHVGAGPKPVPIAKETTLAGQFEPDDLSLLKETQVQVKRPGVSFKWGR